MVFRAKRKRPFFSRRSDRNISATTQRFSDPTSPLCKGHRDAQTEHLNPPLSTRTWEHRTEFPIGSGNFLPFFDENRPLYRTVLRDDSCYGAFGRLVRFSCSNYTYWRCYVVLFLWMAEKFRKYFWRQKTHFSRTKAAWRHFFRKPEDRSDHRNKSARSRKLTQIKTPQLHRTISPTTESTMS